jgi:hypothetical protein
MGAESSDDNPFPPFDQVCSQKSLDKEVGIASKHGIPDTDGTYLMVYRE